MRAFVDANGREWEIRITIGSAARVLDKVGINILGGSATVDADLAKLYTDAITLGKVVGCLLEKQAKKRGIEDFLEEMDAVDFSKARDAFFGELENFFQSSRREDLRTACEVLKITVEGEMVKAKERLQQQYGSLLGNSQDA